MSKYQIVIGRSELVGFPDLLLDSLPAKSDTGAYRSAIHATNIKLKVKGSKKLLSFDLFAGHPSAPYTRKIETEEFDKAAVENSFGVREERYAVPMRIKVGPRIIKTEFTLADRSMKTYPILLGRKLLNNRFLIDSSRSNIDRGELKRKLNLDLAEDLEVTDP